MTPVACAETIIFRNLCSCPLGAAIAFDGGTDVQPDDGGKHVFVQISAVERAGLDGLNEGQKVKSDVMTDRGKARRQISHL